MSENNERRKFVLVGTGAAILSTLELTRVFHQTGHVALILKEEALRGEIKAFGEAHGIDGDKLLTELQNSALTGKDSLETAFRQIKEAVCFKELLNQPASTPITLRMMNFKIPEVETYYDPPRFNGYMGRRKKR